ncbi:hypothetical protein ACFX1Q_006322 [Malus domestica]
MADLNSVKVVEVCKVAPQPSTPDSSAIPESLPLTLFDLLWLRFAPVQRLFFYEINNPNSSDTNFTHSTLIPKLKTSLSLTLKQFLPLAGNVIWPKESPKPILRYVRGDGVLLNIAESDSDFHHIGTMAKVAHSSSPSSPSPSVVSFSGGLTGRQELVEPSRVGGVLRVRHEAFDPSTVITIGVFDNGHIHGGDKGGKDSRIGKVRIRLSTLEADIVYTHLYPLLVLHPSGVKKMGEIQLAVRFTCSSLINRLYMYSHPSFKNALHSSIVRDSAR